MGVVGACGGGIGVSRLLDEEVSKEKADGIPGVLNRSAYGSTGGDDV